MRAAVLFGRTRKVGSAGRCGCPRPQKHSTGLHLGCEYLILKIPVRDPRAFDEACDVLGFLHGAREGLLAGNASKSALAALKRVRDLLDVLNARVIGAREPKCIDRRISDHVSD